VCCFCDPRIEKKSDTQSSCREHADLTFLSSRNQSALPPAAHCHLPCMVVLPAFTLKRNKENQRLNGQVSFESERRPRKRATSHSPHLVFSSLDSLTSDSFSNSHMANKRQFEERTTPASVKVTTKWTRKMLTMVLPAFTLKMNKENQHLNGHECPLKVKDDHARTPQDAHLISSSHLSLTV
jgi:hypothetical protein